MPETHRIRTGIAGLDLLFYGGVRRGNLILVSGAPGSGKSLLGLEFVYRGITEFDEPGIVVVFEADPEMLHQDAAAFGWVLTASTTAACSTRRAPRTARTGSTTTATAPRTARTRATSAP